MATLSVLILSATLLLLLLTPFPSAADTNVLLTGQILYANQQLSYGRHSFVMQSDCNLVLYGSKSGFQTNTAGKGEDCTLSFTADGRLTVINGTKATVWISNNHSFRKGSYAAVLRPDGEVAIYGQKVWDTVFYSKATSEEVERRPPFLTNVPFVRNVFFSGQVLYNGGKLSTRDYTFVMKGNCNALLRKATYYGEIWQSGTSGNGQNCFMRLNHFGQLSIVDDMYKTVWNSTDPQYEDEGEYVLVLQYNGRAAVYGPVIWTTAGRINMVTDQ